MMTPAAGRKSRSFHPPWYLVIPVLLFFFILPLYLMICSTSGRPGGRQQHHVKTQHGLLALLLIDAIIKVESAGDPLAVSKCGSIGLMQVRWSVWKDELRRKGIARNRRDLFDPETNKRAGKYILARYLRIHKGDLRKSLRAYSGGARNYYGKVMEALDG